MNFITDFPLSVRKDHTKVYNAILVVICKFIKFAVYIPTQKDINTVGLINLLLGHIIEIYEYPYEFQIEVQYSLAIFIAHSTFL
jgi:hypothetical protein